MARRINAAALRAKNKQNSALRGNVPTQKTIFNDFVEEKQDTGIDKDSKIINEISAPDENSEKHTSAENNISDEMPDKSDAQKSIETEVEKKSDTINSEHSDTKKSSGKAIDNKSEDNKVNDKKNSSAKKESSKKATSNDSKKAQVKNKNSKKEAHIDYTKKEYPEEYVNMTVFLTTELNDYLEQKAFMTGTPIKKVFRDIITYQMNLEPESELAAFYRKSQKYEARRVVSVPTELKADIKLAAMKYRMRMSSFIIYSLAVAMRDDEEY